MNTGKLNIKKFSADEENEHIIETITKTLNNFCFGEYKNEVNYPITLTNTKITSAAGETEFNISCKLHKNKEGMLRQVVVTIWGRIILNNKLT